MTISTAPSVDGRRIHICFLAANTSIAYDGDCNTTLNRKPSSIRTRIHCFNEPDGRWYVIVHQRKLQIEVRLYQQRLLDVTHRLESGLEGAGQYQIS